jgi:hypothetical protein
MQNPPEVPSEIYNLELPEQRKLVFSTTNRAEASFLEFCQLGLGFQSEPALTRLVGYGRCRRASGPMLRVPEQTPDGTMEPQPETALPAALSGWVQEIVLSIPGACPWYHRGADDRSHAGPGQPATCDPG